MKFLLIFQMFWWLEQNKYRLTKTITQWHDFTYNPQFILLGKHRRAGKQGGHGKCQGVLPATAVLLKTTFHQSKLDYDKKYYDQQLFWSVLKFEIQRHGREQHLFTFEGPKCTPLKLPGSSGEGTASPAPTFHSSFLFEVIHTYYIIWYIFWLFSFTE